MIKAFLKWLAGIIFGALFDVIKEKFSKPPEVKQKEADDAKEIDAINSIAADDHSYVVRPGDDDWANPKPDPKI